MAVCDTTVSKADMRCVLRMRWAGRGCKAPLHMDPHVPQEPGVRTASGPARQTGCSFSQRVGWKWPVPVRNWWGAIYWPSTPQRNYFSAVYVHQEFLLLQKGKWDHSSFHVCKIPWFRWRTEFLFRSGPQPHSQVLYLALGLESFDQSTFPPTSHPRKAPGWSLVRVSTCTKLHANLLADQVTKHSQGPENQKGYNPGIRWSIRPHTLQSPLCKRFREAGHEGRQTTEISLELVSGRSARATWVFWPNYTSMTQQKKPPFTEYGPLCS